MCPLTDTHLMVSTISTASSHVSCGEGGRELKFGGGGRKIKEGGG